MNGAGPGEAEWKDDVRVLIDEAGSVVNLIVNNNIKILTSIASFVNSLGFALHDLVWIGDRTFFDVCVDTSEYVNSSDMVEIGRMLKI